MRSAEDLHTRLPIELQASHATCHHRQGCEVVVLAGHQPLRQALALRAEARCSPTRKVDKLRTLAARRLSGMPGLTCAWQVCCRTGVDFADWVRMDLRYLQLRSLQLDLKLLAKTAWGVVRLRGAL